MRNLPWLFAAFAAPACLFLALIVPPGEAPDEPAHVLRADSLWHSDLIGYRQQAAGAQAPDAGVTANRALRDAVSSFPPGPIAVKHMTGDVWRRLDSVRWGSAAGFVSAANVAVYFPVVYIPAALALGGARAAGLPPMRAVLAARAGNAAAFVALGSLALAIARAGRLVMFTALMLPMTVFLAASVNPDGLLVATAAVAAAGLTRIEAGRRWPQFLAGGGIALLGATKPGYLPMALAMLAPLRPEDFSWRALRPLLLAVIAVAAPGFVWAVVAAATVAVPFARPPAPGGPLWPGDPTRIFLATDPGAQLLVLLHRPWRLVTVPLATMLAEGATKARAMIGVLGQLDLVLPVALIWAWMLAGLAAIGADLAGGARREAAIRPLGAVAILLGLLGSVLAIYVLQYLSWTPVGAARVEGVQGRYFLPLLPFAGVALSAVRFSKRSGVLAAVPVLVAAASAGLVMYLVAMAYYLG